MKNERKATMMSNCDRSMIKMGLSEESNDGSSLHDNCRRTFSVGHQGASFGSQFLRDTDQNLAGIHKPSIIDHIGLFRRSTHLPLLPKMSFPRQLACGHLWYSPAAWPYRAGISARLDCFMKPLTRIYI